MAGTEQEYIDDHQWAESIGLQLYDYFPIVMIAAPIATKMAPASRSGVA